MPKSNINPKRFAEEIPIEEVELKSDYNGKAWKRIKKMEARKKIYTALNFDERIYGGQEPDFIPTFQKIADALLNKTVIQTEHSRFYFQEIEFYLFSGAHPDPFVHRNEQQREFGQWYSHAAGLDLCLGNKDLEQQGQAYFGILIRSIGKEYESLPIYGPLKVFDSLIANYGSAFGTGCLKIETLPESNNFRIESGTRIGLKDKPGLPDAESSSRKNYREMNYRFFVHDLPERCKELKKRKS